MPISYTCRACGCAVADADLRSGRGARSGRDIYCAECAALLTEPAEPVAIQVPPARVVFQPPPTVALVQTPLPRRAQPVLQPPPAPVMQLPGLDEEFQDDHPLPEAPPAEAEERDAEEEYDEPRRPSRARTGRRASAPAPARPASGRAFASPPARPASGRGPAAGGSGARRQASGQRLQPAARAAEPPRPPPRPSGRRLPERPPPAPPPEPEPEPPADTRASGRRRDSKRMASASGRASGRAEADDRSAPRSRREEAEAVSRGGVGGVAKNPVTLVLIIAGGAIVIGLAALLASGTTTPAKKPGVKVEAGTLTPDEYVKRAQAEEAKGNKMHARDCWLKAAEGFESKGMSKEAEKANCEAVRLRLGMTLNDTSK